MALVARSLWEEEVKETATQQALRVLRESAKPVALGAGVCTLAAATACILLRKKESPKTLVFPGSKFSDASTVDEVEAESLCPGSPIATRAIPACQATIAMQSGDNLIAVGSAIRTSTGLWVPSHVIESATFGSSTAYIVGHSKNGKNTRPLYQCEIEDAVNFGTEMLNIRISDNELSALALKVAQFTPLDKFGATATIAGPDSSGSMGLLKPDATEMGRVVYHGSTVKGYSGSAYMLNSRVAGIHLCGGKAGNAGQEALFLKACLSIQDQDTTAESSEDFFRKWFDDNPDHEISYQADKAVVRDTSGHYHVADSDLVQKYKKLSQSKNWGDLDEAEDLATEMDRRGIEFESVDPAAALNALTFLGQRLQGSPMRAVEQPTQPGKSRVNRPRPSRLQSLKPFVEQLKKLENTVEHLAQTSQSSTASISKPTEPTKLAKDISSLR
uniref:Uncharacterized protein n=1 Tax=Riboviria sp. TaxID=2585031 RepID=A0A8K1WSN0_9VIRU|nr:MAG: hypothetical protein 1 [Riboviria sp.]